MRGRKHEPVQHGTAQRLHTFVFSNLADFELWEELGSLIEDVITRF
jgi:hypothetical protein